MVGSDEGAQALILFVDLGAHFPTMGLVAGVELGEFFEFGRSKIELTLHPGELRRAGLHHLTMSGGAEIVEGAESDQTDHNAHQEGGEQMFSHSRGVW